MLTVTLKGLLAHKLRLAMSAFAIVLGVAFVAGTFMFTDTLNRSFTELFRQTAPDVTVRPAGAADTGGFTGADARSVPAELAAALADVPGVARVDGTVLNQSTYLIGRDGKIVGSGGGAPGIGTTFTGGPAADGSPIVTLTSGNPPAADDQFVVDDKSFAAAGFALGDEITLVTTGTEPTVRGTLVGTARFGRTGNTIGATLVLMDPATAQRLYLGGADAYTDIAVTGDGSVDNAALAAAVGAALPAGYEALDDARIAAENQSDLAEGLSFITTFLLVFAAVALVVGTFLILNTFSIVVAQRTRELALLRALGASRRQVTRSVLTEALVVGVVGSTVGLALGLGLAVGLKALFGAIGLDLSSAGLVFQWRTVVVAYAVGVLITLLAAYLPARRAAQVPPVAALRDDVAMPESSLRRRLIAGAVIGAAGAALMVRSLAFDGGLAELGAGVLGVFVGVALISPVIGRPLVALIAWPFPRLFGPVGRLARENARRNPRRTSATASALMIGLALVSAMAVIGQSAKASVDALVASDLRADYVVSNAVGAPFSAAIGQRIAALPGVAEVVPVRYGTAEIDGSDAFLVAADPTGLGRMTSLVVTDGRLDGGGLVAARDRADASGWRVGDTVAVTLPSGVVDLPLTGIVEPNQLAGSLIVPPAVLDHLEPVDSTVYVAAAPGADSGAVTAGIDAVIAELPTVTAKDQNEFAAEQRAPVDQLLAVIYALLGLAVIIAVLGIVNTLALSVIERTREVGLLRAIGLGRRQLRTMVRLESVAIAVLGAVLGVGLGLVFGVSIQRATADDGIRVLSVPVGQLVVFVLLSAVIGVLAAVWPARRAARMDVLRAITAA
ncbi:ABC transporter permease [Nakamurella sp.]|uniref:ABC transporter permease n=1 Tax=Nakamurella sp. TaxID=1869182 RepID=UPI003B3B2B12